jgi:hypothetical protein
MTETQNRRLSGTELRSIAHIRRHGFLVTILSPTEGLRIEGFAVAAGAVPEVRAFVLRPPSLSPKIIRNLIEKKAIERAHSDTHNTVGSITWWQVAPRFLDLFPASTAS